MPDLNWNVVLSALVYAALTGIFNLLLGHKSQVEAWAQSNPGIAAVLKLTRAVGFDPWNVIAALSLTFAKKLPDAQQSNSPIAIREEVKAEQKAAKREREDPSSPLGPLAILLLAGLSVSRLACHSGPPPCDEAKLRAIDAAYLVEVGKTCLQYSSAGECPEMPELRAKHTRDLEASCPR